MPEHTPFTEADIISETYMHEDGVPVVVCVLELPMQTWVVGYSVCGPRQFRFDIAKQIARRKAVRNIKRVEENRFAS